MNLTDARKLGRGGFVRSQSTTNNHWVKAVAQCFFDERGAVFQVISTEHIDAEDWEPQPTPSKFQGYVWIRRKSGEIKEESFFAVHPDGWERILVKEITENE